MSNISHPYPWSCPACNTKGCYRNEENPICKCSGGEHIYTCHLCCKCSGSGHIFTCSSCTSMELKKMDYQDLEIRLARREVECQQLRAELDARK